MARTLLVCTDGSTDGLDPWLRRRPVPVRRDHCDRASMFSSGNTVYATGFCGSSIVWGAGWAEGGVQDPRRRGASAVRLRLRFSPQRCAVLFRHAVVHPDHLFDVRGDRRTLRRRQNREARNGVSLSRWRRSASRLRWSILEAPARGQFAWAREAITKSTDKFTVALMCRSLNPPSE